MEAVKIVLTDNSQEALSLMGTAAAAALMKCALLAHSDAVDLCPVKTGRLRNSITWYVDESGLAAYIGTNTEYASYVELGTCKKEARAYLKPAITNNQDQFESIIKSAMKSA